MPPSDDHDIGDSPPVPSWVSDGETATPDIINVDSKQDSAESSHSLTRGVSPVTVSDLDRTWTPYFRYESVYQDQIDAVDTFLELLSENGYYVFEGACGTGKTLAAVTGGIHAIRDQSTLTETLDNVSGDFPDYSRLFVVTPLKQQLHQFVREMKGINASLPEAKAPVSTVVIRGRTDMMPYAYVDLPPFDRHGVGEKMDDLREMTRKLIKFDSDIPLDWPEDMSPPDFSKVDYNWDEASLTAEDHREQFRYDPARAEAVTRIVNDMDPRGDGSFDRLTVNGVETPYPDLVPHTNDVVDTDVLQRRGTGQLPVDLQGKFDPFYAGAFKKGGLPFDFHHADNHVFDQETLFQTAASRGICPHEAMEMLAERAEVVLGNYYHLFDPQTRLLTDDKIGLLDSETIVAVDEGHQIEERVRDMLSMSLDIYTLDRAINDLEIARNYAVGDLAKTPTPNLGTSDARTAESLADSALGTAGSYSVTPEDLAEVEQLLRFAKQKLTAYGSDAVSERYQDHSWQEAVERWGADPIDSALCDPESDDPDKFLSDAVAKDNFDTRSFLKVYPAMLGVKFVFEALEEAGIHDRTPQGVEVGKFFKRWAAESTVEYYREVVLDDRQKETIPAEFPDWVKAWTPKFQLFNCIPRDELRAVFGELGGGVLMSATLQPEEVFTEAVGINDIPYPKEDEEDDDNGGEREVVAKPSAGGQSGDSDVRPTAFEQYPLRFPEENRASLIADLPKFTSRNRGKRTTNPRQMKPVRKQYADLLEEVVASRGNILVAMPNYREAKWAHDYLKKRGSSKRFHLDQSSSALETDETLESFFADGDAVIFTSARSTITEGVDYDGEKLHGCVVVGIPLVPVIPDKITRTDAVIEAYDEWIGAGSGFETALTIPAVWKVRQAFGRVIRGTDEAGFRLLADERYGSTDWDGVNEYLSEQEREEFQSASPEFISQMLSTFWDDVDERERKREQEGEQNETDMETTTETVSSNDDKTQNSAVTTASSGVNQESSTKVTATSDVSETYSKIYFGDGSNLSNWTPIRTDIAENEIIPLVREHTVDEESGTEYIQLNFAKELSVSGWTKVDAEIVHAKIEPIAKRARK
ncbi:DEAD/DEAH box helicase (plasmid) [Haloferax larsenii]|uniref:DEAD/DEAH box helicase n=1 Tax=Haloferax larsenii TaxID=302484 RepID=A0ABY5RJ36_HALLR|nr:helicase C-terminal domain-containing protein [Haloferax larsenii]UVE52045.1 DEAD/DEAH box helicase [Haloferax larsenii]